MNKLVLYVVTSVLCLTATCHQAPAQPAFSPDRLPPDLREDFDLNIQYCRNFRGSLRVDGPRYVREVDINGDGRVDYILDQNGLTCVGRPDAFCLNSLCGIDFYVAQPNGRYQQLRGEIVRSLEIGSANGRVALIVQDEDGSRRTLAWDGRALAPVRSATVPPLASSDEARVRAFVAAIYDRYRGDPGQGSGASDFTPQLDRLIEQAGELGADPFCECQDYDDTSYIIRSVAVRGAQAEAQVAFSNFGGTPVLITLRLLRTPAGWRVDDVIGPVGGSLRAELRR